MTQSAVHSKIRVDRFALTFYTLNHAYSEILNRRLPKEPLSDLEAKICKRYENTIEAQARFLFAYLTLACVREARHADEAGTTDDAPQDVRNFFESILDLPKNEVEDRFIHRDINCTAGDFFKVLSLQFVQCNYPNSFGGQAVG
nr:unknown [Vibrio phage 1]